jgi:hypothetical protein
MSERYVLRRCPHLRPAFDEVARPLIEDMLLQAPPAGTTRLLVGDFTDFSLTMSNEGSEGIAVAALCAGCEVRVQQRTRELERQEEQLNRIAGCEPLLKGSARLSEVLEKLHGGELTLAIAQRHLHQVPRTESAAHRMLSRASGLVLNNDLLLGPSQPILALYRLRYGEELPPKVRWMDERRRREA